MSRHPLLPSVALVALTHACTDAEWSFRPRDRDVGIDLVVDAVDASSVPDAPTPTDLGSDRPDAPPLADAGDDHPDAVIDVDREMDSAADVVTELTQVDVVAELSGMDLPADLAPAVDSTVIDATDALADTVSADIARADIITDACPTGLSLCPTGCVDITTHPTNCGACGRACVGSERCLAGSCRPLTAWARVGGSPYFAQGDAVALDLAGNVYLAGIASGPIDLGGGPLAPAGTNTSYAFLASFTAAGAHRWSLRLGGPRQMGITGLAIGPDDSVVVLGMSYGGTTDIGGTSLTSTSFLASVSSAGTVRWARDVSSAGAAAANDLAIDATGNLYVVGSFSGTVNVGGDPLVSAGDLDILVASFSNTGAHRWSRRMGGPDQESGNAVAMDARGNLLVAGTFASEFNAGGGVLSSAGRLDAFAVGLTGSGVHRWSQRFGGDVTNYAFAAALDTSGNSYIAGGFTGNWIVDGRTLSAGEAAQAYVTSFSPTGAPRWTTAFGAAGVDLGRAIAMDPAGNLYVTGEVQRTVDFGGGALAGLGGSDLFATSLTSSGAHRWSRRYGGAQDDRGQGIAVTAGSVFIAGSSEGTPDLGVGLLGTAGVSNVLLLALTQ